VRWPTLAPTTIFPAPLAAQVVDEDGIQVSVSARGALSGTPTAFRLAPDPRVADSNKIHPITTWAGPWLVDERWWDPRPDSRRARFQFTTADTRAWLFTLHQTTWQAEATYD
jgi:protein ImuB